MKKKKTAAPKARPRPRSIRLTTPKLKLVPLPKTISIDYLIERAACHEQVARFEDIFGDEARKGVPLTKANIDKALAHKLDVSFLIFDAAEHLQDDKGSDAIQKWMDDLTKQINRRRLRSMTARDAAFKKGYRDFILKNLV